MVRDVSGMLHTPRGRGGREVQRRVLKTSNDLKIRHRVEGNASTYDDYVSTRSII